MKYSLIFIVLINVISFLVYGIDKWKARRNAWRVSERTLLLLSFLGGSIGALAGMYTFRHKTKHKLFVICVPLSLILHIVFLCCILHKFL